MTEFIEPEVVARIYERAKRKCECENLRCKHVAGTCRNAKGLCECRPCSIKSQFPPHTSLS